MDLIITQKRFQDRQRSDTIRKLLAVMSRHEITITELSEFEDVHASITPAEMMKAAKTQKPIKYPKSTETKVTNSWSL